MCNCEQHSNTSFLGSVIILATLAFVARSCYHYVDDNFEKMKAQDAAHHTISEVRSIAERVLNNYNAPNNKSEQQISINTPDGDVQFVIRAENKPFSHEWIPTPTEIQEIDRLLAMQKNEENN